MALAIPGFASPALSLALPQAGQSGEAKLEPRFAAILNQCKVKVEHMKILGDADITTAQEFGHIAKSDDKFAVFLKRIVNLDPDTRGEDALPSARFFMAWENCKKRNDVETEQSAQRAAQNLPVTVSTDDHQSTREAWERVLGRGVPDHKIPSENYFERKVGELETCLKAEALTSVTSLAQEKAQKNPQSVAGTSLLFDSAGHPTLKTQKKDFFVAMPEDEHSIRSRFELMGGMLEMLKMRFMANPIIATASIQIMKDYAEYLCGEKVWGLVVKGTGNVPISCPHVGHVLSYDSAIRELAARLMKSGRDYKSSLEMAMADNDTRTLHFTTPFSMEANTSLCRALSAPGLREIYPNLPALKSSIPKKVLAIENGGSDVGTKVDNSERNAVKRAKKKLKQDKKKEDAKKAAQTARQPLAILDAARPVGNPKGAKGGAKGGKGKKGAIPKGIKSRTDENEFVCFAHNLGETCKNTPCTFKHVCWWCHKAGCPQTGSTTKSCC